MKIVVWIGCSLGMCACASRSQPVADPVEPTRITLAPPETRAAVTAPTTRSGAADTPKQSAAEPIATSKLSQRGRVLRRRARTRHWLPACVRES